MGKSTISTGPFSIAMLVYQRVRLVMFFKTKYGSHFCLWFQLHQIWVCVKEHILSAAFSWISLFSWPRIGGICIIYIYIIIKYYYYICTHYTGTVYSLSSWTYINHNTINLGGINIRLRLPFRKMGIAYITPLMVHQYIMGTLMVSNDIYIYM